jgi:hypothetical protein
VLQIQLTMERLETMEQTHVARPRWLLPAGPRWRRRMFLHGKLEKLALSHTAEDSGNPGIKKPDNRFQNGIRSVRVAAMNPQNPPVQAEHDGAVRVGDDSIDIAQPQLLKPGREMVIEQEQLCCFPSRLLHSP